MVLKLGARFRQVDPEYSYVWIIRMVVYRLINYFGYDVVSYDTDAIPLRNLQPVFDKYRDHDIIGSAGHFPFHLGRAWGFTLCMGVVRFKSNANTGKREKNVIKPVSQIRSNFVLFLITRLSKGLSWCGEEL